MNPHSLPFVTIVIPCLNEEDFIENCLRSLLDNGYARGHLEILVVDGQSEDRTRELLSPFLRCDREKVRLLENPKRHIPSALNIGIRAASHAIVMRADAHGTYPPGYIEDLVMGLLTTGADVVGGTLSVRPRSQALRARAIALVYSSMLAAGGARYKTGEVSRPLPVDTVAFGCFRRDVFDRFGFYNEDVLRSEDIDLMSRIRRGGGRLLMLPRARSIYYVRSTFGEFFRHSLLNGYWVIYPLAFTRLTNFRPRHFVPMAFVTYLLGVAGFFATGSHLAPLVASIGLFPYALLLAYSAIALAIRGGDPRLAPLVPLSYLTLHVGYGIGSLGGVFGLVRHKMAGRR